MSSNSKIEWTPLLISRFWSYVQKSGPDDCWVWIASRVGIGYGQFRVGTRKVKAHRAAYELTNGSLGNHWALHRCDNPPCCNPAHLFRGTAKDNSMDREQKGRGAKQNIPHHSGEKNSAAKLRSDQVVEIRLLRKSGHKLREIAAIYGICKSQVRNITTGKSWQTTQK